jgi:hypothetical protein
MFRLAAWKSGFWAPDANFLIRSIALRSAPRLEEKEFENFPKFEILPSCFMRGSAPRLDWRIIRTIDYRFCYIC